MDIRRGSDAAASSSAKQVQLRGRVQRGATRTSDADDGRRGRDAGGALGETRRDPGRGGAGVPRSPPRRRHPRLQRPAVPFQRRPRRLPEDAQAAAGGWRAPAPDGSQPPPPGHLQLFGLRPDPRDRTRSLMRSPTFAAVACTSDEDDDRVLVERYLSGDRDAFTSLVVRYQRPIYNAAFWVLRKHEDAHDISQTVFLKEIGRAS